MANRLSHMMSARLERLSGPRQWLTLLALSAALVWLLEHAGIPAAILIGPLLAGAALAAHGVRLQVPKRLSALVPGIIGCMIAHLMPVSGGREITEHLPIFLFGTFAVIAISVALGWLLTRQRVLPGTTALWGLSPGAASVMVLMAEAYKADAALVALMQYLRVVMVTSVTAAVATLVGAAHTGQAAHAMGDLADVHWLSMGETLAVALIFSMVGKRLRIPGGTLVAPMIAALVLSHLDLLEIELPHGLLMAVYALLGWRIGLRFTAPLLAHAARALPRILVATLILMVLCGALAGLLAMFTGVDLLSAYLATSPGGVDSVAIIAASTHVDVPFVMGMQMVRFIGVLVLGPIIVKLLARRLQRERETAQQ